jgi:hypothetical protein
VHKCITALTEACPTAAVLAFDASNAFNTLPRTQVLAAVRARAPALLPTVTAWLGRATTHTFWDSAGKGLPVHATTGVDQGCPLSPALFAIGIADALEVIHTRLLQLDGGARLFSYLDDIMVVVPANLADAAGTVVHEEMPCGWRRSRA